MKTTSRARIAVFTKQLDSWRSGSGHHLNRVMARLLELNGERSEAERIDFTFIHYKSCDNPLYAKVRELIVPRNPLRSAAVLRRERFDLVHYTPLTIYAPIYGVPNRKVATIHGVEQLLIPRFFGPLEMFHERHLVPRFARRMDGILTVSNTTKRYLVERFGVRENRVAMAYNGIGEEYRPRRRENLTVPGRLGLSGPYVYHISRFSERKNPWVLLDAFARFVSQGRGRPHSLVCAGSGWDNGAFLERCGELGLSGRVLTPGFIPESDSAELMAGADLFVFPSLAEGFGMPNAEAMASGCPVVASAVFAVPEVVGDGALLIDDPADAAAFAEAMGRLADDTALRESLVEKGLARVRSGLFSWDAAARTLLGLYERILFKVDS